MHGNPSIKAPTLRKYESLDFWRGIACLIVVIYHSSYYFAESHAKDTFPWFAVHQILSYFWTGVPFFFVISGYCISAAADAERGRSSGISSYFKRRVRRIFPPYWVAFLLLTVFVVACDSIWPGLFTDNQHSIQPPWYLGWRHFLANVSLTETWVRHTWGSAPLFFIGPAWTLCYEEQFYAVTGMLLFVPRLFFHSCVILTVMVHFLTYFKSQVMASSIDGFFFDGHWIIFAFGIAVYFYRNYATYRDKICIQLWLLGVLVYSLRHPNAYQSEIAGSVFAIGLIAFQPWDKHIMETSILKPILFCGRICYSLYLLHWPVCKALSHLAVALNVTDAASTIFVVIPACIAASISLAYVFHVFVERRFMNPPRATVVI